MKNKRNFRTYIQYLFILFFSLSLIACNTSGTSRGNGTEASLNTSQENSTSSANDTTDGKVLQIGVIQFAEHPSLENCYIGFMEGLKESGYEEGEDFEVDYQVAQADPSLSNQIAENFVSRGFDLIVGIATPAAQAAYNAAQGSGIPVIFNAVTDPIAAGLQAEDGSNVEGITGTSDVLPIKQQLAMIRAFQPEAKRLGILYTLSETNSVSSVKKYEEYAEEYGFTIVSQSISQSSDVPTAAQSLMGKVDAITNLTDNTVVQNMAIILDRAQAANIPYYGSEEEQVANGLVASEGLDYLALGRKTGEMAASIFKGEDIQNIPVYSAEESKTFYNSESMESFGLTLPDVYQDVTDMAKAKAE